MLTIDAHQHFWKYHPGTHAWIDDAMKAIRQNFMPNHLQPVLQENNVNGCVTVQVDQTEAETDFMMALANDNTFIKAVVGWVDLKAANILEKLAYYKQFAIVKGFRHIVQGQAAGFMLQDDFLHGIKALKEFGFTYDILIYPNQLLEAVELVKKNPNQLFVIDHLAKPYIKAGLIDDWKKDMNAIAQYENVYCKISGMVTEADYENWKPGELTPYLEVVTNAFGTDRIMYGSDWPVCLVAAPYKKTIEIVKDYFKSFSKEEQEKIFALNAIKFYKIK
jgi:L-fuconolactonase